MEDDGLVTDCFVVAGLSEGVSREHWKGHVLGSRNHADIEG